MDRGVVGYLDKPSRLPKEWETEGFRLKADGNLTFVRGDYMPIRLS
jgi:hypothetical protein